MDNATILYIIAGIIGIVGLSFAMSRHSTINGRSKWIFALPLLAGAVFLVLWQMGSLGTLGLSPLASGVGGAFQQPTQPTVTQVLPSGFCPGIEDTTVTLSGYDTFSSAPAGGNHRYREDSGEGFGGGLTVADAGTFTSSPGNRLNLLFGNASTTGEFSVVSDVVVPCSGTVEFRAPGGMTDNGTITTTFRNTVGDRITATGTNQTVGANDLQTVDAKLTTTSESAFPYGIVIVLDYNKTAFDNVNLQKDGVAYELGIVPNTYTALWGANGATKAYIIPDYFKGGVDLLFKVDLDSSAMNPTVTNTANVTLAYFPRNPYINNDLGGAYSGPSHIDEDSTLTRPQAGSGQLYYD